MRKRKYVRGEVKRVYISALLIMVLIGAICGTYPAVANVEDNLASSDTSIIGKVDDTVQGTFYEASTNAKLNSMKGRVDGLVSSVSDMVSPYVGNLTVWIDSTDSAYEGKSVTLTDSKGNIKTSWFAKKDDHYEVSYSTLLNGEYYVTYPFINFSGSVISCRSTVVLAGDMTQQLFGDYLQSLTISEIQDYCKSGKMKYLANVGDTITDGTYTYTIIGINQDKPSDADGNLLDSSQYGDVLTVMPLGAPAGSGNGKPVSMDASKTPWGLEKAPMNSSRTNTTSWKSSKMRSTTMVQYLAKLPADTQKVIGYVQKITGVCRSDDVTISTGDKCFLLSGKELSGGEGRARGSYCSTAEAKATVQYRYFEKIATSKDNRNINASIIEPYWFLRSPTQAQYWSDPSQGDVTNFCYVMKGSGSGGNYADYPMGVFPAFCIY